jgi:hypothetical protein
MEADELFEHEEQALKQAMIRLEEFEFGSGSTTDRRLFEMAAKNEFGQAGFGCHIHWEEVVKRTPLGDIPQDVWIPSIQDVHRLKKDFQFDHDKFADEVVHGKHGGGAYLIREDGSIHDPADKIKKTIT